MSERSPERRIPTPLVLALASGMVSVGVLAFALSNTTPTEDVPDALPGVMVDDSTPERAAESFLDAWRKRAHQTARDLTVGEARAMVDERAAADEALSESERDLKRQVWDAMAASRLSLYLNESENLEGGRLRLSGTAEGEFLERPYERAMDYVMSETSEGWRVESVAFGEILSDVPDVLRLEP